MKLQPKQTLQLPPKKAKLHEATPSGDSTDCPLIAIVGPTAVGKTALAVRLCQEFDGEVISADSRQVYRGIDIGTAKPTPEERQQAPHHLIDVVDPDEEFTLAEFQACAYAAIDDVLRRGRLPFLVGGTGQYVRAVLEGWTVPRVPPNWPLRQELHRQAEELGPEALHARLAEVDPQAARKIDSRNVRRVIRALEVYQATGVPISHWQRRQPPPYRVLRIGLTMPRHELYHCIDARVDHMMEAGLLEEVRRLVEQGYGWDLPAMSGLGYAQLGRYLRGEVSLEEAVRLIKHDTRRFVRHQYNWFRLNDPLIHWFDVRTDPFEPICALIRRFLANVV